MNERYNELVEELAVIREAARNVEYMIEEEFGEAAALEAIANT